MKVRVSEVFSLIFGNSLLIAGAVYIYWGWKGALCAEGDYGCQNITVFSQFLSILGCVLPLVLWVIFTIYAVVSDKELENKRTDALCFSLLAALCLLLVWIITAFITGYAVLIVATLLCLILVITDILYARALVLQYQTYHGSKAK